VSVRAVCVAVVLGQAAATYGQLVALKDGPVVMGHVGLNSTSAAEHKTFWSALGGRSVSPYNREMFAFPNIYVSPGHGSHPKGGTVGTTIDHLGFRVTDLGAVLTRMEQAGYRRLSVASGGGPNGFPLSPDHSVKGAFLMAPDGLKIELLERPRSEFPIAVDHVHFASPDAAAMRDWYVRVLGARPAMRGSLPAAELPGIALVFQTAEAPVAATVGRVLDHVTFEVRGLAAFCERLQRSGVTLDRPYAKPASLDLGVAFLTDPWGTSIEFTEGYDKIVP
jgi:catechol 2,3-dioxygenase-like lactoylglutathione lyase family enzyme